MRVECIHTFLRNMFLLGFQLSLHERVMAMWVRCTYEENDAYLLVKLIQPEENYCTFDSSPRVTLQRERREDKTQTDPSVTTSLARRQSYRYKINVGYTTGNAHGADGYPLCWRPRPILAKPAGKPLTQKSHCIGSPMPRNCIDDTVFRSVPMAKPYA
jgi:hypothetical protein